MKTSSKSKTEIENILESAKRQIMPHSLKLSEADEVIKTINERLKKNKIDATCVAGGSYAKGTILKNDFDIDLFVRFSQKHKDDNLSNLVFAAIEPFKPELVHGSRDYYQVHYKNLLFEVIPVIFVTDFRQIRNVTDMSPLHVEYVRAKFKKKNLADDVRLAKQFCKAAKVYGAESYIRGFSGHVLDLLVIHYGGFLDLLMQASAWGPRAIIDTERHLKDPLKELNESKLTSPLIIVDPVQPDRNAAAAISREKYELFKKAAQKFLQEPSEDFFRVKPLDLKELKKKAGKEPLIIVKAKPLDGKKDVVGTKIMKCYEHMLDQLLDNDFTVIESGWEFDSKTSTLYFMLKNETLSEYEILRGPPVKAKLNASQFKEKHKDHFEKEGRLYAREPRQFRNAIDLLASLSKTRYIQDKAASMQIQIL